MLFWNMGSGLEIFGSIAIYHPKQMFKAKLVLQTNRRQTNKEKDSE